MKRMDRLYENIETDKQIPDYVKGLMLEMMGEMENIILSLHAKISLTYFRTKQNTEDELRKKEGC